MNLSNINKHYKDKRQTIERFTINAFNWYIFKTLVHRYTDMYEDCFKFLFVCAKYSINGNTNSMYVVDIHMATNIYIVNSYQNMTVYFLTHNLFLGYLNSMTTALLNCWYFDGVFLVIVHYVVYLLTLFD